MTQFWTSMLATLGWKIPDPLIFSIGAVLLAAALGMGVLTSGLVRSRWLRLPLGLAGVAIMIAACLDSPPRPITMSECTDALKSDDGISAPPRDTVVLPGYVGIGSGGKTGTYYELAENIVELAKTIGLNIFNVETLGSFDNLRLIRSSANVALGFAQSDILSGMAASEVARLRLVLPLYREEIHVLARRDINQLSDLSNKVVVTARSSMGSQHTARNILKLGGVTPVGGVQTLDAEEAVCRVVTGQADAMFVVAGKPTPLLKALAVLALHRDKPLAKVHFMPLKSLPELQQYEQARLTRGDYPWAYGSDKQQGATETLAVRALLMAYDFSARKTPYQSQRCDVLKELVKTLVKSKPELCQLPNHPKWCEVDMTLSVSGWRWDDCSHL